MNESSSPGASPYIAVLKRNAWLATLVFLVTVAIGAVLIWTEDPVYQATTDVLAQAPPSTPEITLPAINIATEARIIDSPEVAERVADESDSAEGEDLLGSVEVTPQIGTEILTISYKSGEAAKAAELANAFAASYVALRTENIEDAVRTAQQRVETQLDELRAQREGSAGTERESLDVRIGILEQRLADLQPELAEALGGARVLAEAGTPGEPVSPNPVTDLAQAVLLGLILGVAAAFAYNYVRPAPAR
ncbi:MAG: Wzz/FepE/Etk N-terminal domain-containing protein [Actinomycetota bacterium]